MKDDFYRRPFGAFDEKYQSQYTDDHYNDQKNDSYDPYVSPDEAATVKRSFSRIGLSVFLFFAVSAAVAIAAQILIELFFPENADAILSSVYTTWVLNVVAMYVIAFPITYLMLKKLPCKTPVKANFGFDELFLFFLIAEGVMMMGNLIGISLNSAISSVLGKPIDNSVSDLIQGSPIWIIVLVVVFIGPIVEEVIFRKLIIDRLMPFGAMTAVAVSSVAFGLFHGNLYQLFYATGLGFVLGYIYAKTGKLRYTVAIHMIINFLGSVVAIPLGKIMEEFIILTEALTAGESIDTSKFALYSNVVVSYTVIEYGMALAGIVILVKKLGAHTLFLPSDGEIRIPKKRAVKLTVLNVGVVLFLLSSVAQIALSIFGI